jgi:hypothetical protein
MGVGNQVLQQYLRSGAIRAKLAVGSADDPAEAEADRIAQQIMSPIAAPCACGGTCASCRGGSAVIRRKESDGSAAPAARSDTFGQSTGRPLSSSLRAFFEPRLGVPLDAVRVHDNPEAAATAKAIRAQAYTAGNDIGFAAGQFSPETQRGRWLLAHELAHVAQGDGIIRRRPGQDSEADADDSDGIPGPPEPKAPEMVVPPPPPTTAPSAGTLNGIPLVADEAFMTYQMEQLVAREGTDAPYEFWGSLVADVNAARAMSRDFAEDREDVSGAPLPQEEIDAKAAVADVMRTVMIVIQQEEAGFYAEFLQRAKAAALDRLAQSEKEERAEAFRYGIDLDADSSCDYDDDCGPHYSMDEDSPTAVGLQAAAKILLDRRKELDEAKGELDDARDDMLSDDSMSDELAEKEAAAEEKFQSKANTYDLTLGYLGRSYPILKALGDPKESADDLETVSENKAGPETATVIGAAIVERLHNIKKVRNNIDDPDKVDIWRLPALVGLASAAMSADTNPFYKRLVDEEVEAAKPGMFESIALLLFNIAAIALAGPTGGVSLAVAAGVNAVVTYEHIQDYQMQSALSGTAFDRAEALSQDKPSFFWLAVEIVGVALDVSAAFKTVSEAVEAVRIAKEAGDAAEIAAKTKTLEDVARAAGGEELVRKVLAHIGEHPGEDVEALQAIGLTTDEIKSLGKAASAAENELGAASASGELAAGGAKVSKAGHIFSCSSPCTWMREKYAALFSEGVTLEGDTIPAAKRFADFEQRAQDAADAVTAATNPEELKQAQQAAKALEAEITAFDEKLAAAARVLEGPSPEVVEALVGPHPQLAEGLAQARKLSGAAATDAMADLVKRAELIRKAEAMSTEELEKLLDSPEYAVGTASGSDLRYVRYLKNGGELPYPQWESLAERIWENRGFGSLREKELKEAFDLEAKNTAVMKSPAKGKDFIPDHVRGSPGELEWGKSYHFEEIKDWKNMSDTGNLSQMLDYVEQTDSKLTIYYKSNTYMSGPLRSKIEALMKAGKVELIPFVGE